MSIMAGFSAEIQLSSASGLRVIYLVHVLSVKSWIGGQRKETY